MTDRELLDQFVEECNETVFEDLVRRHGGMVFGVCRRILGNHHDAEEAFQATFLVLAKRAGSISRREALANWLFGVARRTALKAKATRAKRFAREKQVESMPELEHANPQRRSEIEELLDVGLSRLPEKYRVAVVLCDLEGKSHREAGQELGCPEGTVSSRVMRARAILARWFGRQQGLVLSAGSLAVVLSQQSASATLPTTLVASTSKAASLSALGHAISASVIAPHVAALATGVLKSLYFTTLKNAAAALVVLIAIGVAAGGLVHWLQAAERPARELQEQPIAKLPEPLDLLAKYETTLAPYTRMKGIWTWNTYVWQPGEKPQPKDEVEECSVLLDRDRTRLFYKTTGGGRKVPRLWEEFLEKGKGSVCASNDNDVVTAQLNVSEENFLERIGVVRSSPGFGVIDGKSIPAFLHKSKLSVQTETLDGNACFALRGVRDDCDITIWLDPTLRYSARRVLFHKRSAPSDATIRTCQFDAKRFQHQANGPVVDEATCTLTIGPQPIFQSVGVSKVVKGKTVIEYPLLPAKDADGKIIMQPARCCRWEIHTVACDLDPHLKDADFRMTVPIKNGTRVSMSEAPMAQYVWKDGTVQAGGWKRNLSLYQNRRTNSASERFARSLRDARLCSLCVLVAAMGDVSESIEETLGKVLDFEESKDSLRYLPITLTAAEVHSPNGFFDKLNLQPPKAGEILLAAFAGDGRQIGALLLSSGDISSGGRRGIDFLKAHAPAARDARKLLAEAQKKARETDRRVWIVAGGSRCGPCFRLARWMDDQHALLDQDYVIVKFIGGLDEHVDEVLETFKRPADAGVPWFAITDAEGTPLATSDSPHGNIGFPSEQPEKLHFLMMLQKTAQRLNTGDRDRLLKSLGD
jgi:RNA polymerase sigma factor (sigma-70 family)